MPIIASRLLGSPCAPIEHLTGAEGSAHFNSVMAPLDISDGQLHAQMLLAAFMPVDQILEESYCRRQASITPIRKSIQEIADEHSGVGGPFTLMMTASSDAFLDCL